MRLFIAINFDDEVKDILEQKAMELKRFSRTGSFTSRENFHLTLAFIGETERVNDVKEAMNTAVSMVSVPSFSITVGGTGRFWRREGDIYWIGVREEPLLWELNRNLVNGLRVRGFDMEDREFKPHLTLGRKIILPYFDKDAFEESMEDIEIQVSKICLMKSEVVKGQLGYTEMYSV